MPLSCPRRFSGLVVLWSLAVPFLGANLWMLWLRQGLIDGTKHDNTELYSRSTHKIESGLLRATTDSFPRWGEEGILLGPLMDFIFGLVKETVTTITSAKTRARFPETLYIVDAAGVWCSLEIQRRTLPGMIKARVTPAEQMFRAAWNKLQRTPADQERWPRLQRALDSGGFPFLAWYGDYKLCNFQNWKGTHSIPLFTVCATVGCNYTIPIPNYSIIKAAKNSADEWTESFRNNSIEYPAKHKIRQIVWRGSLSAPNDNRTNVRWRASEMAKGSSLLNIGLTAIPNRHNDLNLNLSRIGGLRMPICPMSDFQKFIGILDMDGNSWSSRWCELLCYNSVALKVEPEYVDYFHFRDLQPWKHYVPIKSDLSDLVEAAQLVTDPSNGHAIQRLIGNANQWCREKLLKSALQDDMLHIWESYLALLDRADPNWSSVWNESKAKNLSAGFCFATASLTGLASTPPRTAVICLICKVASKL